MTAPTLDSTAAAEFFFAGAVAAGMTDVVISPGSRSAPLSIAADRTPGLATHVHLDERSAAFAALGQAKVTGTPVGLVCTSGTAVANWLPALSEASLSNVALVAVSADRPPEHQNIGVGQTFDQRGLFHQQVRTEITMPVGGDGGEAFSLRAGWRSVAAAIEGHGPVHVNWAFRLPLEPQAGPIAPPKALEPVASPSHTSDPSQVAQMSALLAAAKRPVIVAGPAATGSARDPEQAADIVKAATTLGIPILADVLSGLRGLQAPVLIDASALVVEMSVPRPDLVIRVGHTPTSKATRLWWESGDAPQVLIDPLDDWQDPSSMMVARLRCAAGSLLAAVAQEAAPIAEEWLERWVDAGRRAASTRAGVLDEWDSVTEAHIASAIGEASETHDLVVASSSMPIRDLDTFTTNTSGVSVWSNRGINGIDGVISTAIGVSRAAGKRVLVHVGDVAALHDIGGILDAARQGIDMTIVIPNNDGGGIFSLLPARNALPESQFTRLFHTPHGTDFGFLAGHDGVEYQLVTDGLAEALRSRTSSGGVHILEVPVSTTDRLAFRDHLVDALRSA